MNRQKSRTTFFALITWWCFFYGLGRCQIRLGTGSLSRYTYTTVFTVKKMAAERKYCHLFWNVFKLSLEREVLREIWTIFRGDIAKRISGNLTVVSKLKFTAFSKLKTEKKFNQQVQNVTGPESKHLQLPEPIVVYDKLGRELEHFNWALFSVLSPKPIQILYSQFANLCTLKPKRIKLARYV